ncbi:YraN family protein [Novosphingobium sp.]|uniref:YraN family protein n=1 Tax=Novosphingobium sp. TaxID=1874826 RepID=UPI001EC3DEFC|nr:YraN family protein [Novosphingobium sp.]MBK6801205.1 YraN family protein [Novosphingobium sp.]MBK9011766.1 YraN family protein [Novosphingobium sp.]
MTSRAEREARGRRGETLAAWYLRFKGWRIVAQRVKTPRGEVDLIARRGRTLAFIEVKWRATAAQLDHAVDPYRLRRVAAAAEVLAARHARPGDTLRIDVLLLAPGRFPRHMANALMP